MKIFHIFFLFILNTSLLYALPPGFVYLHEVDPTILQDIRYATDHNFVGRPIKGYEKKVCILTAKTAQALARVQTELKQKNLSLKVFDCYRPTEAVTDFIAWSENSDQKMKMEFYPRINKKNLFKRGYLAKKSQHSLGNTVDITIDGLDMGSHYDFLDEKSHLTNKTIGETPIHNRKFLNRIMMKYGFVPYRKEWWHFSYPQGTVAGKRFNFPVK